MTLRDRITEAAICILASQGFWLLLVFGPGAIRELLP